MNYLLGILLIVFTIASFLFLWSVVRAALAAAKHHAGLIWSGTVIAMGLLLLMHFGFWTSISRHGEANERFAAVRYEVNGLKADNTAIKADHEALKPLAANAAALLNMGSRVELADAKVDKALAQIGGLSDDFVAGLNKVSTNLNDRIDQRLMALRIALQREQAASAASAVSHSDGRVINPSFPPLPTPPPAPVAAAPQPPMAIGVTVPPGYSIQRDNSSELAKVEQRLAQLEKARQDQAAKQAQKSAKATQKVAAAASDKGSQAEQVALLAMKQVTELSARQNKVDDKLADMSKAIDKILAFMISTNVSLPAMTDTNPPTAQVQPAQPAAQAPAPTPAPAVAAPQPAPVVSAVQPPTNNLVSFTVTNTFAVGRSLLQVQRWPWEKGGMIAYEVTGWIKPGDNMVNARQIVQATTERFHNKNGVWFAGKDPSNAEVYNKFVFEFGESLKAVRKGNPGWDHLDIDPVFRTNPNGGAISTNGVAVVHVTGITNGRVVPYGSTPRH